MAAKICNGPLDRGKEVKNLDLIVPFLKNLWKMKIFEIFNFGPNEIKNGLHVEFRSAICRIRLM